MIQKLVKAIRLSLLVATILVALITICNAEDWRAEAYEAQKAKQYDRAIIAYSKVLEMEPMNPAIYNNRGNVYRDKGQFDEAIRDYNEAIRINPKYETAFCNRGKTYYYMGDYEAAMSDYNEAISLNPQYSFAYDGRGMIYKNKGQIDEAIDDFSKSISLNPRYLPAFNNRGICYQEKKQYDAAINDFSEAIQLNPGIPEVYNNRAMAYSAQGKFEKAVADFDQSKNINPNDVNIYFAQAELYVKINKYKEAVDTYYEVVGKMPADRKSVEEARERVNAMGYLPYNLSAVELQKSAMLFSQIVGTPIWIEETAQVIGGDTERAKKFAIMSAKMDGRKLLVDQISQNNALRIPRYSVDFSNMEIVQEDAEGKYGKMIENNNGTEEEKITFRFLVQCQKANEINPFVKKQPYSKPAIITEIKEFDDYWEIVAAGYGFYEGFEDIDYKRELSFQSGIDSACQAIVNKAAELGATDETTQNQIINTIKSKRNYGGIYYVLGCGVETDARIPIRLYKKDYSIKFIYN